MLDCYKEFMERAALSCVTLDQLRSCRMWIIGMHNKGLLSKITVCELGETIAKVGDKLQPGRKRSAMTAPKVLSFKVTDAKLVSSALTRC